MTNSSDKERSKNVIKIDLGELFEDLNDWKKYNDKIREETLKLCDLLEENDSNKGCNAEDYFFKENSVLKNIIEDLQSKFDDLNEIADRNKVREKESMELKEENEKLKENLTLQLEKVKDFELKLKVEESSIEDTQRQISLLKEKLEEALAEKRDILKLMETKEQDFKTQLLEKSSELRKSNECIAQLEEKCFAYKNNIGNEGIRSRMMNMQNKINSLMSENKNLKLEVQGLKDAEQQRVFEMNELEVKSEQIPTSSNLKSEIPEPLTKAGKKGKKSFKRKLYAPDEKLLGLKEPTEDQN